MARSARAANPNPDSGVTRRSTSILDAVKANDLNAIETALADDPSCINDVDPDTRQTPAHIAARKGYFRAILRLLSAPGIDLTIRDAEDHDVFASAVLGGHRGIICEVNWAISPELRPEPGPDGKVSYDPT